MGNVSTVGTSTPIAIYIPPFPSSPVPFRDDEKDCDLDFDLDLCSRKDTGTFNSEQQSIPLIKEQQILLQPRSIIQQQTQTSKRKEDGSDNNRGHKREEKGRILGVLTSDKEESENARVAVLEERVRDLEEKLSTLSILWLQSEKKS